MLTIGFVIDAHNICVIIVYMTTQYVSHDALVSPQICKNEEKSSIISKRYPRTKDTSRLALYFETSPRYTPSGALAALKAAKSKAGR